MEYDYESPVKSVGHGLTTKQTWKTQLKCGL